LLVGHSRVGKLPATLRWNQVIALIANGAGAPEISAASALAAERSLADASNDAAVRYAVWLLTQIPLAARTDDFEGALRGLGLDVGPNPTLIDICTAFMDSVDAHVKGSGPRSDLGEMAQLCAVESLNAVAGRETARLFGPEYAADEARASLHGLATPTSFGILARDFFARLTRRYLDYYLGRQLPEHVGVAQRFRTVREHHEFEQALHRHCREASLIAQEFAGDWFSKANYEGGITLQKAGGFAHIAFKKIREELRLRRDAAA